MVWSRPWCYWVLTITMALPRALAWLATSPNPTTTYHHVARRVAGGMVLPHAHILGFRGGSSNEPFPQFQRSPMVGMTQPHATSALQQTSSSSSASSTSSSVTTPASADKSSDDNKSMEEIANESLSIVGTSIRPASLCNGQVSYWDTRNSRAFRVVFVLGGPGAGKGTQSELMLEHYPCVHLSAGELLREETKKPDSPQGALIEQCLVSGNIVPVEISLSLLQAAMQEAADQHGQSVIVLVDGFPRNFDNLQGWIRCMADNPNNSEDDKDQTSAGGVASVWAVLNYQCPLDELERRILDRAKDSGRSDDNLTSARKRFATFERETVPVVDTLRRVQELLQEQNQPALRVCDIRGDQTVPEVWDDTQAVMNQLIRNDVLTAQAQLWEAVKTKDADLYRKLCADEWFEDASPKDVLQAQEDGFDDGTVSQLQLDFLSGTKVAVKFERVLEDGTTLNEKRIWSHQGIGGWKNIHFSRVPQP